MQRGTRVARSDAAYLNAVWQFNVADVGGEPSVAAARHLVGRASEAWRAIHAAHSRTMADQTKTEAGRLASSAKIAREILDARRTEHEAYQAARKAELASLRAELQRRMHPPATAGEAELWRETRAYLRSLPVGERMKLAEQSMREGDPSVMHALVAGHAFLGMLPPEVHGEYVERYLMNVAPERFGEAHRLTSAIEQEARAFDELEAHANSLIDFNAAHLIEQGIAA